MTKPIDDMTKQELDDVLDALNPRLGALLDEYFSGQKPGYVLILGTYDYRCSICHIANEQNMTTIIRRAADIIDAGQKEW